MRTRISSLLAITALVAACSSAATPAPTAAPTAAPVASAAPAASKSAGPPLVVGAVIPLSGGQASYGNMAKGGLDIAVAELNAAGGAGGRQITVNYQDNQGVPATSATAAQTLMGAGIKIIFTHGSSVTAAIYNVTKDKDILLANMAAQSDAVIAASTQVYSFLPTNNMELGNLADLAYNKLGLKTLAIEASDDDYGKSATGAVTAAYKALGGTIVDTEVHTPGSVDMRTQLIKIKSANPGAIAILANTGEIGQVIKQAKELGITATLMGADSALSPSEATIAGSAMEGVVGVSIRFDPALSDAAKKFFDAFKAKNNMDPNNYAAIAYEAAKVTLAAAGNVGESPQLIGSNLLTMKGYTSILGPMSFGSNRVVTFPITYWKFTGGQVTVLK